MGLLQDTPFVERPEFFKGQRLFALDLQYIDSFNREMRWLHNKSLHQPGIGNGYAVSGEKGDRVVTVGPGYALDAEGREIILTREQSLSIPPVEGEVDGSPSMFDLTVNYADELEETETRKTVCAPSGVVRRQEAPVFCWVPLHCEEVTDEGKTTKKCLADMENKKAIQTGHKIVIARLAVKHCALFERVSLDHRRSARSCRQPWVYGGRQRIMHFEQVKLDVMTESFATLRKASSTVLRESPSTPSDEGVIEAAATGGMLVLKGQIDTSSANFLTVPSYHVELQRAAGASLKSGVPQLLFQLVHAPQPDGFDLLLAFSPTPAESKSKKIVSNVVDNWEVSWLGIEG
jgi:hypothetical protein